MAHSIEREESSERRDGTVNPRRFQGAGEPEIQNEIDPQKLWKELGSKDDGDFLKGNDGCAAAQKLTNVNPHGAKTPVVVDHSHTSNINIKV